MAQILVVDDDKSIIESFRSLFRDMHVVLGAYNGREALTTLSENKIDLVFLDYRIPGEDGLEVLNRIKKSDPDVYVIIISGYGNFETIIQAMASGAFEYIEKPLDAKKVSFITKRALEMRKATSYVKLIKDREIEEYSLKRIVGKSGIMQEVFKNIGRLVNNNVSILITGESGTGKELVARAIHFSSPKKEEPFMAVNCSGLSETLLENELFGHEKQAFTGAESQKKGKFEVAGEGTIFLDEIGDMPLSIQSKLLRVLQEKEFHRLGGTRTIQLKARIIAATNKQLFDEVQKSNFRQDLFYRINVASIEIPPLRERLDDIPLLVDYFIKKANLKLKKNIKGISMQALNILRQYHWPGNVRELENIMLNICIHLQGDFINSIPHLQPVGGTDKDIFKDFIEKFLTLYNGEGDTYRVLISLLEKELLNTMVHRFNGNKSEISKFLGISRVTLQKKLEGLKS